MRYLISDDELLEWIKSLESKEDHSIEYVIKELENIRRYPVEDEKT